MAIGYLISDMGTFRLSSSLVWESQDQQLVDLANWLAPVEVSDSDGEPHRFLLNKLKSSIGGEVVAISDPVDSSWIGVDLDGTLAFYDGYKGVDHIGDPIPEMLGRVKRWLVEGKDVRIFTARVANPAESARAVKVIQEWTHRHLGVRLPVTATKDHEMIELWDDRAVVVEKNTGMLKSVAVRDGDGDGMIHDGTPQERPAEVPTHEEVLFGRSRSGEFRLRGLLRSRIASEGQISLIGQKISGPEDLASVAQIYRDPRYETLRAIFVRDGVIVGQNAYSNRMPSVVAVKEGVLAEAVINGMKQLEADQFYLMHNHPSGDPTPSREDISFTERWFNDDSRCAGHVIINHKKSTFLGKEKSTLPRGGEYRVALESFSIENEDLNSSPEIPHELLGYGKYFRRSRRPKSFNGLETI